MGEVYILRCPNTMVDCEVYPQDRQAKMWNPRHDKNRTTYYATVGDRIVGTLCVLWLGRWKKICSCGTVVSRSWQNKGVATMLWDEMIDFHKPKRIYVSLVSDRGLSLIASLKENYRWIEWQTSERADRKLRVLKRK